MAKTKSSKKHSRIDRDTACLHNSFISPAGIHATVANVSAGLTFLSFAAGCAHDFASQEASFGLDLLMQTMGDALEYENRDPA